MDDIYHYVSVYRNKSYNYVYHLLNGVQGLRDSPADVLKSATRSGVTSALGTYERVSVIRLTAPGRQARFRLRIENRYPSLPF